MRRSRYGAFFPAVAGMGGAQSSIERLADRRGFETPAMNRPSKCGAIGSVATKKNMVFRGGVPVYMEK